MSLVANVTPNISFVFNTPVLVDQVPDCGALNAGLRRLILEREAASRGLTMSNLGGWHSDETLLSWPGPEIAQLKLIIDRAVQRISRLPARDQADAVKLTYGTSAWANVNRNGHYNGMHSHAGQHWAVVYYVDIGRPAAGYPTNGQLELHDPRHAAAHGRISGFMFGHSMIIHPKPGMVVVFPAWIEHSVHPYFGEGERISIAVNVKIIQYEAPPARSPDQPT